MGFLVAGGGEEVCEEFVDALMSETFFWHKCAILKVFQKLTSDILSFKFLFAKGHCGTTICLTSEQKWLKMLPVFIGTKQGEAMGFKTLDKIGLGLFSAGVYCISCFWENYPYHGITLIILGGLLVLGCCPHIDKQSITGGNQLGGRD